MTFAGCAAFSSSNNNSSIKRGVLRKNAEVDAAGIDSGAKRSARALFDNTGVHLYLSSVVIGLTFQMSRQYSRIERSEQKWLTLALSRVDMLIQFF